MSDEHSAYFDELRAAVADKLGRHTLATLHRESHESTDELVRINELGLLTMDSQQGRIEYGRVPTDRALYDQVSESHWQRSLANWSAADDAVGAAQARVDANSLDYVRRGGRYTYGVRLKERAYLIGIAPRTVAETLLQLLNQEDNVVAWYVMRDYSSWEKFPQIRVFVTYDIGGSSPFDEAPLTGVTHVNNTNRPLSEVAEDLSLGYELIAEAKKSYDEHYVCFTILDGRYGHSVTEIDGLFKRVIRALELIQRAQLKARVI